MNWMDLLRMSTSNLKRRKLRTFLTVLGVVIGTASIVVMISLGLGMQQSLYREVEQSGGLTTIKVSGAQAGNSMMYSSSGKEEEQSTKYINDQLLAKLSKLEHVALASPVYELPVVLLKGGYEGYGQLLATTPEAMEARNINLAEGSLPKPNSGHLDLVYGNGVLTMFNEKGSGKGYYETGRLPDIDLAKDSVFLILDQEGYYSQGSQNGAEASGNSDDGGGKQAQTKTIAKHVAKASGIVAGGPDEYNANYYNIFCDLDTLKQILKKEFNGRVIPGQPTTKTGKPYKEFCYSYAQLKVDDIDNVDSALASSGRWATMWRPTPNILTA